MVDVEEPPAWGVRSVRTALLAGLVMAGGCSPSLNWRESRLDVNGVVAMLPCKPESLERTLKIGTVTTRISMQSCEADGGLFAVSSTDVSNPALVNDVLDQWKAAAAANVGATARLVGEPRVSGMTPNPNAAVLRIEGHAPDGSPLTEQASFFVKGTRVFQGAVVARSWKQDAADTFFEGMKFP